MNMSNSLMYSVETWKGYWGDGFSGWLLIVCLVILIGFSLKNKKVLTAFFAGILSIVLLFIPLTKQFVSRFGEDPIYWRLLWIVPNVVIVSLALTLIIDRFRSLKVRIPAVIVMIILIGLVNKGHSVSETFVFAENIEQLPQYIIDCADIVLSNPDERHYVGTDDLMGSYIRVYAPEIRLPYGRAGDGRNSKPVTLELYQMCAFPDYYLDVLPGTAETVGVNYLILQVTREDADRIMAESGWEKAGSSDPFTVYRFDEDRPADN